MKVAMDYQKSEKVQPLIAGGVKKANSDFYPGLYLNIARRTLNNINYIANLIALRQWYLCVRSQFFQEDIMSQELYEGTLEKIGYGH